MAIKNAHLIGTKPGGTSPAIAGTRIRVAIIVKVYQRLGEGDQAIHGLLEAYPHLTKEQVVAALDYWRENRDEIDGEIAEDHAYFEKAQAEQAARLPTRTP